MAKGDGGAWMHLRVRFSLLGDLALSSASASSFVVNPDTPLAKAVTRFGHGGGKNPVSCVCFKAIRPFYLSWCFRFNDVKCFFFFSVTAANSW